jgi:hypothetical protein
VQVSEVDERAPGVAGYALDADNARRLWTVSEAWLVQVSS